MPNDLFSPQIYKKISNPTILLKKITVVRFGGLYIGRYFYNCDEESRGSGGESRLDELMSCVVWLCARALSECYEISITFDSFLS